MAKEDWEKVWDIQERNMTIPSKIMWVLRHSFSKIYAKKIASELKGLDSPRILEIGCGTATIFNYIKKLIPNAQLNGLDYSENAIKLAKKQNPDANFILGDARNVPIESNSYDLVYSLGLCEHFERAEGMQVFNEHARVAKEGGIVFIVVPAKVSPINLLRVIYGKHWVFGFDKAYTQSEFETMLEIAGLEDIQVNRVRTTIYYGTGIKKAVK